VCGCLLQLEAFSAVRASREVFKEGAFLSPTVAAAPGHRLLLQDKPRVAVMAPDALRQLAKGFRTEATEVKHQIVNLAAKVRARP
jgi:hypothetical protein